MLALAERIGEHGVVLADEVGMGKTRIAVELIGAVNEAGGRAAIIAPPGLGYQWQDELKRGGVSVPPCFAGCWVISKPGGRRGQRADPVVRGANRAAVPCFRQLAPWRGHPALAQELVPEVFAQWRKATGSRYPNGYLHSGKYDKWVTNTAASIVNALRDNPRQPASAWLSDVTAQHPGPTRRSTPTTATAASIEAGWSRPSGLAWARSTWW